MGLFLLIEIISLLVSMSVYFYRAGGFKFIFHTQLINHIISSPGWSFATMGKMLVWPIILALWIYRGFPPSPWETTTENGAVVVRRRIELTQKNT